VDGVDAVERGAVLSYPHDQPHVVMRFMAQVILFTDTPLHEGDGVTLRYGTAERRCRVQQIQRELDPIRLTVRSQHPRRLPGHSVGEIEFSARVPLCLEKYSEIPPLGRFILEDATGPMAAGIVLETFA
jgi:elongation factor 1-alpha